MTEWREEKLENIFCIVKEVFKPSNEQQFKYIGLEHIEQGSLRLNGWGYSNSVQSNKYFFKKDDVLFGKLRPYFRKIIKAPFDGVCSTDIWVCRAKNNFDQNFLFYFLANQEFVDTANSTDEGTRMPRADWSFLKKTIWNIPPLPEQKAIAEVLSSLDDKIDLLTKQNKTLEDLAQAYFRKWFIEDASDEWEIKKLRDFGEIICGKTPPTTNKKFFNGNIPFIKIPDMHNNVYIFDTADTLSEMGAKYQENKFIPPMSICVSCIATVGLVSMNVFLSQTNQQINSLIPKHDKYRYYLFLFLRSYRDELLALGSGGTMTLNINKTLFGDIECYCPDDEILFRFNNVVNPLFGKIYNNCKQIRILSKLRNTLLPKLISGEIRVKM